MENLLENTATNFLNKSLIITHTPLKESAMKKGFDFENPADSAWALFEQTGEISYYLLYKKLIEK